MLVVFILGESEDQQWYYVRASRNDQVGWIRQENVEITGTRDWFEQ